MEDSNFRSVGYQDSVDAPPREEIKEAIKSVGETFKNGGDVIGDNPGNNGPLDSTVEASIQFDLLSELRHQFNQSRIHTVGGYLEKEPAEYKEGYFQELCRPTEIRRVQPEVNVSVSSKFNIKKKQEQHLLLIEGGAGNAKYRNVNVDIAVLEESSHPLFENEAIQKPYTSDEDVAGLQVVFAAGSKYFPPGSVSQVIEVKFFKDIATPGSGLEEYAGKGEIKETPEVWDKIDKDLQKLSLLSQCHSAESHLVIFSNFNIFRTNEATPSDQEQRSGEVDEKGQQRLEGLKTICENLDIHLWEYHPEPQ
jgi:hypothetical protein